MKNMAGKNAMKMKECIDFTGFSRSTKKIYELQRMTVGTKINYVSMKQNEVKEDA